MTADEVQESSRQPVYGYSPDEMSTGERTGAAKLKWVVIVDEGLSPGQAQVAKLVRHLALLP